MRIDMKMKHSLLEAFGIEEQHHESISHQESTNNMPSSDHTDHNVEEENHEDMLPPIPSFELPGDERLYIDPTAMIMQEVDILEFRKRQKQKHRSKTAEAVEDALGEHVQTSVRLLEGELPETHRNTELYKQNTLVAHPCSTTYHRLLHCFSNKTTTSTASCQPFVHDLENCTRSTMNHLFSSTNAL
mmetsp:Transcript_11/g.20  ORF Transcript_11/g.20 Transcript_11/m.20 type:complete len:187 (+) Transcript_11:27-587(+)